MVSDLSLLLSEPENGFPIHTLKNKHLRSGEKTNAIRKKKKDIMHELNKKFGTS